MMIRHDMKGTDAYRCSEITGSLAGWFGFLSLSLSQSGITQRRLNTQTGCIYLSFCLTYTFWIYHSLWCLSTLISLRKVWEENSSLQIQNLLENCHIFRFASVKKEIWRWLSRHIWVQCKKELLITNSAFVLSATARLICDAVVLMWSEGSPPWSPCFKTLLVCNQEEVGHFANSVSCQ